MAYGTIKVDTLTSTTGTVDLTTVTTDEATTSAKGYMSAADKAKLDGIETGATADQTLTDLGLENVDNTSDANKPISTATQTALDAKADLVGGKLSTSQIPDLAVTEYKGDVADQTAMLAVSGEKGDWVTRQDDGKVYIITGDDPTSASDWAAITYPASPVTSVAGKTGVVTLVEADITDLGNYADTSLYTFDGSGNFTATGNVTAYSDANLKENIEVISGALGKVASIRGVTYDRKDIEGPRHAGVIAQEVEAVLPEVVMTDAEGLKSVAYGNLVGLLIEAVKELKAEVETLKQERN